MENYNTIYYEEYSATHKQHIEVIDNKIIYSPGSKQTLIINLPYIKALLYLKLGVGYCIYLHISEDMRNVLNNISKDISEMAGIEYVPILPKLALKVRHEKFRVKGGGHIYPNGLFLKTFEISPDLVFPGIYQKVAMLLLSGTITNIRTPNTEELEEMLA